MKSPKEPSGRAICRRGSIARTILLVAVLKIFLSDNTVCGTIMSECKQLKYTQQRSVRWVYSQSGSINRPGFERLPAKLRSFERCQVARRRIAYAGAAIPRVYQSLKAQWSQFRFTQLSEPLERHIVPGSQEPFVFVGPLSMTVAIVVIAV